MATFETIMFMGGPLDGQTRQGAFGHRLYFDANLQPVDPGIAQDNLANVRQLQHRYKRSLPTYEFEYEGFD